MNLEEAKKIRSKCPPGPQEIMKQSQPCKNCILNVKSVDTKRGNEELVLQVSFVEEGKRTICAGTLCDYISCIDHLEGSVGKTLYKLRMRKDKEGDWTDLLEDLDGMSKQ